MRQGLRFVGAVIALGAALLLGGAMPALAQTAGGAPPADFVAPAEPKPDESNAQRSETQPGNNAPFWRSVRESGHETGITNLPGTEKGTLVQTFVQYPGSRFTTAGEAWRQTRNQWIIPYGGSLLLVSLLAVAIFYWRKGALGGHVADMQKAKLRMAKI